MWISVVIGDPGVNHERQFQTCQASHVTESRYYAWRDRPPSNRLVKYAWLTEAIVGIHTASRGTYGTRRVHAELGLGLRIHVSHGTVELLTQHAGLHGLPGNRRHRAKHAAPWVADLVERNLTRHVRDQLCTVRGYRR
jgi:transposase InsO family protein